MEIKRGSVYTDGLLIVLLLWCLVLTMTVVGARIENRDSASPPCTNAAHCAPPHPFLVRSNQHLRHRGHVSSTDDNADDDNEGAQPSPLRRYPRARRQSVVLEVDEWDGWEEDGSGHRVPCTAAEAKQTACLNGRCYALDMAHLRSAACKCPAKWEGDRCELLSMYYFTTYYSAVQKGAIIGGVVVVLLLIIIAISVYCSVKKGKRRRRERKNKADGLEADGELKVEKAAMMGDGESQV